MTTQPKPMDPERLADARRWIAGGWTPLPRETETELLADRDYQAQQAEWRRADLARAAEDFATLEVQLAAARAEVASLRSQIDNTGHTANRSHALELAAALRRETLNGNPPMATTMLLAGELLAADAECRRLRSRVRVEAEDVTARGVTKAHVDEWLAGSQWAIVDEPGPFGPVWEFRGQLIGSREGARHVAATIDSIAFHEERSPWDILDEMARMEVGDE